MLLLSLALAARVLRIVLITDVVEIEGSEYGRIAENLVAGHGYIGLVDGPELMLPPAYPYAIAMVVRTCGTDVEVAGRIVSCVASLLTVLACWLLALRTAGPRVARLTGFLAATVPAFVLTGSAVFSEGLLMACLAFALLAFERAAATRTIAWGLTTGVAFGLAYLTRVESVLLAPVAVIVLATGWPRREAPSRAPWPAALACLVAFVAVAAPYPAWVMQETGEATFAGKSARVFATIERFSRDMTLEEANYSLGPDGELLGPWLTPNAPWNGPTAMEILLDAPGPILRYLLDNLASTAWMLLTGKGVTSLLWLLPFLLAWRDKTRDRSTRALDLLLAWVFVYVIATASVYKVLLRYVTPAALPAVIWAGRGLPRRWAAVGAVVLLLSTGRGLLHGHAEFDECHADPHATVRELGKLVRSHSLPEDVVMADDSRVPFYAGTSWVPTPVATDTHQLVAFARRAGADLVVVTVRNDGVRRPGPWLRPDAPPPGLETVATSADRRLLLLRIE